MSRNIYLDNVSVEEALTKWHDKLEIDPKKETVDIRAARQRIIAEPVYANHSAPHYHASAMDGIAVKAEETAGASETNPIKLDQGSNYQFVDTGDPIPEQFNAVIMIEEVNQLDEEMVEIESSATPWQHVRNIGESLVKGELILPVGKQVGSYEIGLVLEGGITEVTVYAQPEVKVIPTGSELRPPGTSLKAGEITEYNSQVVGNLVEQWDGEANLNSIVSDDYDQIKEKVKQGVKEHDLVVVTAGSSAGQEDYTSQVIAELGTVVVHGVSMKPGGPVILGVIDNTPVIGLPGYPVAAALTTRLFVKPLIYQMAGQEAPVAKKRVVKLGTKLVSKLGVREYVRVKLTSLGQEVIATSLPRASGVIGSLVEADGLVTISEFSEGLQRGEEVEVELLTDQVKPETNLLISGSNDLTLDLVTNQLAKEGIEVLTKSTGSLGGLTALKRQECHLAGTHLLDPETGNYNHSYLEKYLPNREVKLVNLAYRKQGLMVKAGNPKNITELSDLVRDDVLFINRQRGSGTRVLLDYKLNEIGIDSKQITGYDRIEYTHLTLASEIANEGADVGLGVLAAAQAFDLEFIPLVTERYDLAIPVEYWEDSRIKKLLATIRSQEFKQQVTELPGYEISATGKVIEND
ncbi:molybdopterin biosynthesis protein [Halanaerobaculum tunisiense]